MFFRIFVHSTEPYPGQLNNIADDKPKVVNRLKSKLRSWMKQVDDPLLKGPARKAYSKKARRVLLE